MFFSSERKFKKALRDTLMRAAWYELLSTMENCGKIVKFLCLGISIITWVIILKQLFASGSWILVNIVKYYLFSASYSLFTRSLTIFPGLNWPKHLSSAFKIPLLIEESYQELV